MKSLTRLIFCATACLLAPLFASADEAVTDDPLPKINVAVETRIDFDHDHRLGENNSGFYGRYLLLHVNGNITSNLSYGWRQRLNKFSDLGNDVFSATDWLYLNYRPIRQFSVSAGKQVVLIGGFEYDSSPINLFFTSLFWNNIACFQFGVSATYHSPSDKHSLSFQVTNSPYQAIGHSCYAYNLYWNGSMGVYSTLWSANLIEYMRGKYATFISLGNRVDLGKAAVEVDLMNRATDHHKYFFSDYTALGKVEWYALPWLTVMAKGGYEHYRPDLAADARVDKPFYGGGFEFYPIKKLGRNLRLHAMYDVTHDNEGIRNSQVQFGIKWHIDVFKR